MTDKNATPSGDQIQAWADEAEAGYDVGSLKRRGRPRLGPGASSVVPVRLDPALDGALRDRAERDHTTRSAVIRDALRAYLAAA